MSDTRSVALLPLGGADQRWTANAPSARIAQDLRHDPRGAWSSAGGYKSIIRGDDAPNPPFENIGPIESIMAFSQHNGARRWLIYVDASTGYLYTFNPSNAARDSSPGDRARDRSNTLITRTIVSTPWQGHQSACWGDWIYLVNGVDRPLVFNGYFWDYAGWSAAPGAMGATAMQRPHAADSGFPVDAATFIPGIGIGPVPDGTDNYKVSRRYRVSFINDRGAESPLSAPSELVYFVNVTTSGCHFTKITLPIGPPGTVARHVYATQNIYSAANTAVFGRESQFYFHSDIPDNVTGVIQDGLDDVYLTALVDPASLGPWPVQAKFIASFKGRMYALVDGNVHYSRRGSPEVWPVDNVLDVGDANLGPGTGMYATQNALVVSKSRGLYLIKDDGINEPTAETLTRESGWSAPNTIREIPGVGLVGLSDDGITVLQGTLQNTGTRTDVINAAVVLPDVFRRLNKSAILNACAAVYHRDKEYWLAIPMTGNPDNALVLVYHYEIREWTTRENYPISCILEDSNGVLVFGSYASTAGRSPDGVAHAGVFVYTHSNNKHGTNIEPVYETNPVSVAAAFRTFRPRTVLVRGIGHGNNALTVNASSNRSQVNWMPVAKEVQQQLPEEKWPVYGTAVFDGTAKWVAWRQITMRADIDAAAKGPVYSAAIRLAPTAGKRFMSLFDLSIEIDGSDPSNTKPLRPDGSA